MLIEEINEHHNRRESHAAATVFYSPQTRDIQERIAELQESRDKCIQALTTAEDTIKNYREEIDKLKKEELSTGLDQKKKDLLSSYQKGVQAINQALRTQNLPEKIARANAEIAELQETEMTAASIG